MLYITYRVYKRSLRAAPHSLEIAIEVYTWGMPCRKYTMPATSLQGVDVALGGCSSWLFKLTSSIQKLVDRGRRQAYIALLQPNK